MEQDELLNAAVSSFLEFGIKRTSMGEIAKRAGISPATLYRRFSNKTELVQAVGLRELARVLDGLEEHVDRDAAGGEQIVQFTTAVLVAIRNHALFQRLLKTDPEVLLPLVTVDAEAYLPMALAYVTGVIEELQRQGLVPNFPAAPVAEMVVRLVASFALMPKSLVPLDDAAGTAAMIRAAVVTIERGLTR
ncbi:MAG TPA: helix-turn-helix domain-containing protein [Nocardioidaceae bacterium]|nr:helix-turn-helix domain-containing protein [Nocardioidaceae bacterium]